jgi:sulfate transport system substrate-binding protein
VRSALSFCLLIPLLTASSVAASAADNDLLVAAYDVAREAYKDLSASYTAQHPGTTFTLSHGGSSKQARAVVDGLPADLVAMNQALDIDQIAKVGLLPKDWATLQPHDSSPSWSAILFVVRKGNPKGIKDWGDLTHEGVAAIIPNPKTSGNGRYSYLAAWSWAQHQTGGTPATAEAFVADLFLHVPVLDAGGRGATTTFAQRGIGDVLLTFENEIALVRKEFADEGFEVVVPSRTIRADNPVAVVAKNASRKGNTEAAQGFLAFHFSHDGQEIFARNHLRPTDEQVLAAHASEFPALNLATIAEFGGWSKAQAEHFADGGIYDRIAKKNNNRR